MKKADFPAGVWSAAPTPYAGDGEVDTESVARMAEHHLRLGVKGVFVCGTCGEGPWITDAMCYKVASETVKAVNGRMKVTVQVTDNSSLRVLENISRMQDTGVDAVIMAPPFFMMKPTPDYMRAQILDVLENSPLPVGFYHRGKNSSVPITAGTVSELMNHPNLVMIKDSSSDDEDMGLLVSTVKNIDNPPLLLNGNEFDMVKYIQAGYDGVLVGGGCFNGFIANRIVNATRAGETGKAKELQERLNELMFDVFGGKEITCWLAGQKQLMVELGIFSTSRTIINYQLNDECRKAIKKAMENNRELLLP